MKLRLFPFILDVLHCFYMISQNTSMKSNFGGKYNCLHVNNFFITLWRLVPVVQRMNNGIRWINNHLMDRVVSFGKSNSKKEKKETIRSQTYLLLIGKAMKNQHKDVKKLSTFS